MLGAQRLHAVDVALFGGVTAEAGVDLWLTPNRRAGPGTRSALEAAASRRPTITEAVERLLT